MANKSEEAKIAEARLLLEKNGYTVTAKNYFRCIMSGKELSVKQGNFYQTNNPMFSGCIANTDEGKVNLLPYSKKEIEDLYKKLTIDAKGNEKLSLFKLTQALQIPWLESHYQTAKENRMNTLKFYIGKMNSLPQLSELTMADSEPFVGDEDDMFSKQDDFDIKHKKISKKNREEMVKFWGNLDVVDLEYLQEQYDDWSTRYSIDTKSMELLVSEICHKQLTIKKLRENNQPTSKELKDLQDLMNSSALKPIQESSAMNNEANTLGVWIKKIENEEPIDEVQEQYKDIDGIGKMIRVFFLGHFNKMLGVKNELSEEYEREMAMYTVSLEEEDL